MATNDVVHGGTCRVFKIIETSIYNGYGNIFVFELAQSQYIEYVLAVGTGDMDVGNPVYSSY